MELAKVGGPKALDALEQARADPECKALPEEADAFAVQEDIRNLSCFQARLRLELP
jgi:hypothetical protein